MGSWALNDYVHEIQFRLVGRRAPLLRGGRHRHRRRALAHRRGVTHRIARLLLGRVARPLFDELLVYFPDPWRGSLERRVLRPEVTRALWERSDASKGPGITGKRQDWKATNFKLTSFMKDYGLDKTMKGEDPDKESDEEHKLANYTG